MGKRHSPSFPWKEVPRRGGGWNRRGMKGNMRKAFSHIVIPSEVRDLCHSRSGTHAFPHVPRTSPLFSSVFHPARTLSGSLRSPPSPRGEGLRNRICFSFICFHALPDTFASCHPTVPFSRVQGRFLAALEMTIRERRYSHFVGFPIGKKVALGRCAFTRQRSSPLKKGRAEGGG